MSTIIFVANLKDLYARECFNEMSARWADNVYLIDINISLDKITHLLTPDLLFFYDVECKLDYKKIWPNVYMCQFIATKKTYINPQCSYCQSFDVTKEHFWLPGIKWSCCIPGAVKYDLFVVGDYNTRNAAIVNNLYQNNIKTVLCGEGWASYVNSTCIFPVGPIEYNIQYKYLAYTKFHLVLNTKAYMEHIYALAYGTIPMFFSGTQCEIHKHCHAIMLKNDWIKSIVDCCDNYDLLLKYRRMAISNRVRSARRHNWNNALNNLRSLFSQFFPQLSFCRSF